MEGTGWLEQCCGGAVVLVTEAGVTEAGVAAPGFDEQLPLGRKQQLPQPTSFVM